MEYNKKDPMTQFYKMRQQLIDLQNENYELKKQIAQSTIPKRLPSFYKQHFIFNCWDATDYFNTENLMVFITLTFDPTFNLPKTNEEQCNYFTELNYENRYLYIKLFGVYEHHKSGIIHFHGIYEFLNEETYKQCIENFKNKLTKNSNKAVLPKPITNLNGLLNDYFKKESYLSIKKKI